MRTAWEQQFAGQLTGTQSSFDLVEFLHPEATKGQALGKPYRARGLSPQGLSVFHDLLREAIQSGTEETLIAALSNPTYWDRHEIYYRDGRPLVRRINVPQAAERLGLTEFNMWYVRGLARRLLEEGEKACQVYRAEAPKGTTDTCRLQDGQILPVEEVYRGHRATYWPEPGVPEALSVPAGPGCHHTIRRVRSS